MSFCIAPDKYSGALRDHYHAVLEWMLHPSNGKWIVVFDNACGETDFENILPSPVPWGKVVFTSQNKEIKIGKKWKAKGIVSIPILPLLADEALSLFKSRRTERERTPSQ